MNEPSHFVWSKMQNEAGEGLAGIVARKEAERAAGGGIFYWGIGNSLGPVVRSVVPGQPLPVLWSVMLSKPKPQDAYPGAVCIWNSYQAIDGTIHPLPGHVVVTSGAREGKDCHFALVCQSDVSLSLGNLGAFDHTRTRTLLNKIPGASQVTALLLGDPAGHTSGQYRIAFRASLVGLRCAKLVNPRILSDNERRSLSQWEGGQGWSDLAAELRTSP